MSALRALRVLIVVGLALAGAGQARARESRAFAAAGGLSRNFALIGGRYELYVYAKVGSRTTYAGPAKSCVFGGNLQRVGGGLEPIAFGNGVTVGPVVGYKLGPETVSLPAGTYSVFVAAETNCQWHVILQSAEDNGAGVAPVEVNTDDADRVEKVTMHDRTQFIAQYRTDHLREVPVSGRLELVHDGRVMQTFPLKLGTDNDTLASVAYQMIRWDAGDAKLLGKNTARFVMNIGGQEFVSSAEWVLTE